MQLFYKKKEGFTLIEIMVSLVLMGLISLLLFNLFTDNIVYILSAGQRDQAVTDAANIMEAIYSLQPLDKENIAQEFNDSNIDILKRLEQKATKEELYNKTTADGDTIRYYAGTGDDDGFVITIAVYYADGSRYIDLNSYFRKDEPE
ncbi:MAG: type IV pilus modification PilV family protein [Halanaerobiaceae bacterium]